MATKALPLYTIGYEGRTVKDLLGVLKQAKVGRVVDVRQLPLSRKPGFSKSALATFLPSHGIEYVGYPQLGTPPAIRNQYKKSGDFARLRRDYLAYLGTQESEITELRELAAKGGCALLCFERDPAKCHRSILAEVLASRAGSAFRIEHLSGIVDSRQETVDWEQETNRRQLQAVDRKQ
jgi:uncharacterized protein (DUF488 family)